MSSFYSAGVVINHSVSQIQVNRAWLAPMLSSQVTSGKTDKHATENPPTHPPK